MNIRLRLAALIGFPRRRLGQAAEVIYHQAAFLRRELLELIPRRDPHSLIISL
jgi:hypothetical protein